MSKHLPPSAVVERLIGPPAIVGPIVGKSTKTPFGWRHASSDRAAGDIPGAPIMRSLLKHSMEHGNGLTPEHLIFGATEAEVDKILDARRAQSGAGGDYAPSADLAKAS